LNIEEYISTGILEAYVLGELSEAERTQVEKNISLYPELKAALLEVEETLEAFAMKAAVKPRAGVKAKLMAQIQKEEEVKSVAGTKTIIESNTAKETKVVALASSNTYWKYAAAASVAFALVTSYLAFDYRQLWVQTQANLDNLLAQNEQMAKDYNTVNYKLDKIQQDFSIIESTAYNKVVLKGTPNEPEALASVYWNATSEEVFISIQNLKEISKNNQFQLWAIVDGKPVDAGVFDAGFDGLLKMKNIKGAVAFAVTVEPRGGKPSPSLETMRVMGPVQAKG
jgi:anti-sigma-K factor RskA